MCPFVSIVIPVYNAEKSLGRCITSVLRQTYSDYEVILVDDGSSDRSFAICSEFAQSDGRIKVLQQPNGGVSIARNTGLEHARGSWITFIDSDDYVEKNYLKNLVDGIVDDKTDVVITGYVTVDTQGKTISTQPRQARITIKTFVETMDDWERFFNGPCAKLYNTKIIQKYVIRFPAGVHIGEDKVFNSKFLLFCRQLAFVDVADYKYDISQLETLTSKTTLHAPAFDFSSAELRTA